MEDAGNTNSQIKELEKLNQNLNKKLVEINEKLKDSEKLKTNFISNVMNELVNPFTSIITLSENIMQLKEQEIDQAKNMARLIRKEAFNLEFQLNNIFMAARLEAGDVVLHPSKIEILPFVQSIIEDYRFLIEEKNIHVLLENNCDQDSFQSDSNKLKIILGNMLNNALRHSKPGSNIYIELLQKEALFQFVVRDDGEGMDPEEINKIFERFKRLNSSVHHLNPGQGLGLSVVKALADIMEGEILVKTFRDKGSTFTLEIPEHEAEDNTISGEGDDLLFDEQIL